jgi:hypothetical protein
LSREPCKWYGHACWRRTTGDPSRGQCFFDDGLEKLRSLDSALAQGVEVFGHAAIGDAIEPRRVDTCLPQILLQA